MSRLFSLLRAGLSQDMNLFNYKAKRNSRFGKVGVIALLAICFGYCVGYCAYNITNDFANIGQADAILPLIVVLVSGVLLIEGIYKSGGILFDSKDNDMLFAMPIPRHHILFLRIAKFLIFNYIYTALFFIPACVGYALVTQPDLNFYISAALTFVTVPIIPLVVSSIIGYFVKAISSHFKSKRAVSTIFTLIFSVAFVACVFVLTTIGETDATAMLTNMSSASSKGYLPAEAFLTLSRGLDLDLIALICLINFVPFALFIMIFSKSYFTIIARLSEHGGSSSRKHASVKTTGKLMSLTKRELTRFFGSTTYVFNATLGLIMIVLATGYVCFNKNGIMEMTSQIVEAGGPGLLDLLPGFFCGLIILTSCMTCLTAPSISLEGKSFNFTNGLPLLPREIFKAKIMFNNIITIPPILLCDIAFCIMYTPSILSIIIIILLTFIVPTLNAVLGLLINLRFPKMKYTNETEVIKQGVSTLIATFGGMVIGMILLMAMVPFLEHLEIYFLVVSAILAVLLAGAVWVLYTYGEKRWKSLEV